MALSSDNTPVVRRFLTWERPLLPQAVEYLAGEWAGEGPLDLSRLLVIVPTRQSGRRLREALAARAAARGQAVFPPAVLTPDALVANGTERESGVVAATRIEARLAWAEVLREIDLEEFRDVFPVDPPSRHATWALQLAGQFVRLQGALGEGGLRIADVVERAGGEFPEAERWRQLGELERRYDDALAAVERRDERALRIAAASQPNLPPGVNRLIILATPDPLPLAVRAWEAVLREGACTVEVVLHAPEAEADNFDAWGRPLTTAWETRVITLPEYEQRVRLCADPAAQAERIANLARGYARPSGLLGIGIADTEVAPLVENELARAELAAFNPEGRPRARDSLFALVSALAEFATSGSFESGAAVLRCPDVLQWLRARAEGGRFSPAELLQELDDLRDRHLPPTLAAAREQAARTRGDRPEELRFPRVAPALAALSELRATLTTGSFPDNAASALMMIFSARRIDSDDPLAESATAWTEVLRETARALEAHHGAGLALAEQWAVALEAFGAEAHTPRRPENALDLLGWLELLWEDAPHLVIAGFNDGRVPEAIVGEVFLPEALRVLLGLKTNADRLARDAYLLTALAGWRRGDTGRLEILLGKTSTAGDPLRPSRLLLRCPDAELPARVALLFRGVPPARANPPWTRAWRLRPPVAPVLTKVSVTALRDWLNCPFRFYLKHALKMQRIDPAKDELDPRDFGTLVHAALQQLGETPEMHDCEDAGLIQDFLLERFERAARAKHGAELTLPLVVQLEAARQRLRATAVAEARERVEGWRTIRVESPFTFDLGGLTISGKIDRIDRHADGRVRVLDYKTSDTAVSPDKAHLRNPRDEDAARPDWMRNVDADGKAHLWTDLQLPLYLRAVAPEFGDAVTCVYFNLPKAAGDTAIAPWPGYSRDLQASAESCAAGVAAAITAREFWPPRELAGRDAEWDDFAELFHQGAAASIAWEGAPR